MTPLTLTALLGFAGTLSLAAAMVRHQRDLFGHALGPGQAAIARFAGWLLLAASLAPAIARWGWALGITLWLSLAPLAALASVFLISHSAGKGGLSFLFRRSPAAPPGTAPRKKESIESR